MASEHVHGLPYGILGIETGPQFDRGPTKVFENDDVAKSRAAPKPMNETYKTITDTGAPQRVFTWYVKA